MIPAADFLWKRVWIEVTSDYQWIILLLGGYSLPA